MILVVLVGIAFDPKEEYNHGGNKQCKDADDKKYHPFTAFLFRLIRHHILLILKVVSVRRNRGIIVRVLFVVPIVISAVISIIISVVPRKFGSAGRADRDIVIYNRITSWTDHDKPLFLYIAETAEMTPCAVWYSMYKSYIKIYVLSIFYYKIILLFS